MEAPRGPGGRRTLHPFEVQLINQLGITVEEYWQFNDAALERIQERKQGYELIPEIYNEPTTIIAVASLVIGLASTAVGLLMKPKPPSPSKQPERIDREGGDNIGRSKYNPRYGFDSVQELATLGKAIPLIFTRRGKFGLSPEESEARQNTGGTRISSQLIWSAVMSGANSQEVRVAALFGLGEMEWYPEYEGYAIGGTKLESYPQNKVFLTFNPNGNRPKTNVPAQTYVYPEGGLYYRDRQVPSDPLYLNLISSIDGSNVRRPAACGTHSPNTSTQFGLFNFAPNGTAYREPYRIIVIPDNDISDEEARDAIRMEELRYNRYLFPRGCGFTKVEDEDGNDKDVDPGSNDFIGVSIRKDYKLYYTIGTQILPDHIGDDPMFANLSTDDANQVADTERARVDDLLNVGETYRIANFDAVCIARDPENAQPYEGPNNRETITYTFRALGKGQVRIMSQFQENRIAASAYERRLSNGSNFQTKVDDMSNVKDAPEFGNNHPCDCTFVSEINEAVVSMTRATQYVEIGLKSQVWRRINGPNTAGGPDQDQIDYMAQSGSSFTLGQMDRYLKRYSFFRLWYRKSGYGNTEDLNAGNEWERVLANNVLFCIEGNSPRDQYNYIKMKIGDYRVGELNQLYEFRLEPVAGAVMDHKIEFEGGSVQVAKFGWTGSDETQNAILLREELVNAGWELAFNGSPQSLTLDQLSIADTQLGPFQSRGDGTVVALDRYNNGKIPSTNWVERERRYEDPSQVIPTDFTRDREKVTRRDLGNGTFEWRVFWDDIKIYDKIHNWGNADRAKFNIGIYQYRPGAVRLDGNQVNGLTRYEVVQYEAKGTTNPNQSIVKGPESVTGKGGKGLELKIYFYQDPADPDDDTGNYAYWEIYDTGSGYEDGATATFKIRGETERIKLTTQNILGKAELYKRPAATDYPFYEGESLSCDTQPEHEVVYVNQFGPYEDGEAPTYEKLAYATAHIKAGREFSSFSDFSAYIKRGLLVRRLITDDAVDKYYTAADKREQFQEPENAPATLPERYATNLFPEIANALLTDPDLGVGEIVGRYQVDYGKMRTAANYCLANGFTWDGIVAERVNLREWIFQNATYNMLDFIIEGGRFSLVPALLHTADYVIDKTAKPDIAALFTDGNMQDFQASYLQPEDRQLFTAVVLYRDEIGNGFPVTRGLTVSLSPEQGGKPGTDPVEEFDLSDSVTSFAHAERFAKFALRIRQSVTHTIEFSTTINEILGVEPGAYIKVTTEAHYRPQDDHTSIRFKNGSIGPGGEVTSNEDLYGQTVKIIYWKSGNDVGVQTGEMYVNESGYTTETKFFESVFTVDDSDIQTRVYRINSISYGEEGFVNVSATHTPLTDSGALKVADWNEDDFVVTLNG